MMAKDVNLYRLHQQAEPPTPEKAPVGPPLERAVRARFVSTAEGGREHRKETPSTNSCEGFPPSREAVAVTIAGHGSYSLDQGTVAQLIGQAGLKSATQDGGDRLIRLAP
jgi:hypothetical protein